MNKKHLLPVLAVALTGALPAAAQAQAPSDDASFDSKIVKVGKSSAALEVTYTCAAGDAVWVSVKQTANGKKDKALEAEGSSQKAKSWWHSHRNTFVCDGKAQTQIFAIDKVEPGSKGKLKKGKAYVQFCVTAAPTEPGAEGQLTLYKTGWVGVR